MENQKDPMNSFVSRMVSFENMAPNLLGNQTFDGFLAWFERLERYDKRSLYLYLCEHCDKLKEEEKDFAQKRLKKPISKLFITNAAERLSEQA